MSLSWAVAEKVGGAEVMSLDWRVWGSCEAERFGEEVEASDSIDNERCLLRLFVGSWGFNEGDVDGEGGVSIALVVVVEDSWSARQKSAYAMP